MDWPCPYCGCEQLTRYDDPVVVCYSCHVMFTAHWIDGCWVGRWKESGDDGPLTAFVKRRAAELREYATITARGSGRV